MRTFQGQGSTLLIESNLIRAALVGSETLMICWRGQDQPHVQPFSWCSPSVLPWLVSGL